MLESRAGRIAGVGGLLIVLFLLLVGYGAVSPAPELGAYPRGDDLAADFDAYRGSPAEVSGVVAETDPVVLTVDYDYYADGRRHTGIMEITIHDLETPVAQGDVLRVFGTVTGDGTISAENSFTVPGGNFRYMYTVSALAGLWVLGRIVRGWRLDWKRGSLRPRNEPLSLGTGISDRIREVLD